MTHWKLTLDHPTQMNLDLDTLMSQAQSARIFLLIGNVSSVSASTLLDVLNAIDAMSPGCLLNTVLPPDETLMIQVPVQSSFLTRSISADRPPWSTNWTVLV